ncbi:MAG TPA: hypothetical protein VF286_05170 [Acidiphilium sp.]
MKPFGVAVMMLLVLPGVAMADGATKAGADQDIALAKAKMQAAAALGNQWTPTEAAFKRAEAAEQKGDFAAAQKAAARARQLADLSIGQATAQKKLWTGAVPH